MFITAENIRTGEIRTFLGKDEILVPNTKEIEPSRSLEAHWEKVEDCLDLRKYSRFFYLSETEGKWKKQGEIRIPHSDKDRENLEFPAVGIESYRVLGIFLEKD
ncbi:hypothetical protein EHO61_11685 [Leptospira fluminis]|uniref:Uncharacterized protein n=1 Tax=Leptospira fluminis TaxID=2484979 RepID=A0A4R9GNM8_9LEPT|nr:hypothetical protein [Leptospira fluminis]TGK18103.1 hypothetical protein EHO61_11685 [Leptospira fluminis]